MALEPLVKETLAEHQTTTKETCGLAVAEVAQALVAEMLVAAVLLLVTEALALQVLFLAHQFFMLVAVAAGVHQLVELVVLAAVQTKTGMELQILVAAVVAEAPEAVDLE